jgi:quinoprotein glucose dehydrogenase
LWVFHSVPHPGEFGYETWPKDFWKTGVACNDDLARASFATEVSLGILTALVGAPFFLWLLLRARYHRF